MPMFTMEELEGFEVEQLKRLAQYFGVPLDARMSKGRIIERIYRELEIRDRKKEDNDAPASVRVRRIRESQKEKGQ